MPNVRHINLKRFYTSCENLRSFQQKLPKLLGYEMGSTIFSIFIVGLFNIQFFHLLCIFNGIFNKLNRENKSMKKHIPIMIYFFRSILPLFYLVFGSHFVSSFTTFSLFCCFKIGKYSGYGIVFQNLSRR